MPSSSLQCSRRSPSSPDASSHHYQAWLISYLRAPWDPSEQKHTGFCVSSQQLKNKIVDNRFSFHFAAPPVHGCISYSECETLFLKLPSVSLCIQCQRVPRKPGNLFTVPVNREEDAELIWLIARILVATATDVIYLLYLDCFTERVEHHRCIVGSMCLCLCFCVFEKEIWRGVGKQRDRENFKFQIQLRSGL